MCLQVRDEIFIDVHKLLRMCIVLRLYTPNACFSSKHSSRTCRFNRSSCISKNIPFSETKSFRRIPFCQSQFRNDIFNYFVTDKRRQLRSYARLEYVVFEDSCFGRSVRFGDTDSIFMVKGTLTMT